MLEREGTQPPQLSGDGIQGQSFESLRGRLKSLQSPQTSEQRQKDVETKVGGNFILSQSPSPTSGRTPNSVRRFPVNKQRSLSRVTTELKVRNDLSQRGF